MKVIVELLDKNSILELNLLYVVIGAMYEGRWIFVRHKERETWEMPAGHIEEGEPPDEAAKRELREETGAKNFKVEYLQDYSVRVNEKMEFGRLYFAEIDEIGPVPDYEIKEIRLTDELPKNLTYPEVQKILFREAMKHSSV